MSGGVKYIYMHMLSCASIYVRGRELQIGGRFTDRVYANNNAAARSVGIHARAGFAKDIDVQELALLKLERRG